MNIQPPDNQPYERYHPTEPAANPYTDPPRYETTEPNPYISHNSYMDIPVIPPPPPPTAKKRNVWIIVSALLFAIVLVGGTVIVTRAIEPGSNRNNTSQKILVVSPTVFPTATPTATPTAVNPTAIPASSLTASILYEDFIQAGLPVTSPITISNDWWLSMGESYYPARGGVQFTDTRNGVALELAVFNGAAAATEDAQQATSYPSGWAAQYIQVNTCVLFSAAGPVDIQYYKPAMQTFCI